eukprot:746876-Hanusia_phi.AAC.6
MNGKHNDSRNRIFNVVKYESVYARKHGFLAMLHIISRLSISSNHGKRGRRKYHGRVERISDGHILRCHNTAGRVERPCASLWIQQTPDHSLHSARGYDQGLAVLVYRLITLGMAGVQFNERGRGILDTGMHEESSVSRWGGVGG